MRGLAVILTLGALAAAAAATTSAAPLRIARLSAPEQKWVAPLIQVWNGINENLHLIQDEERAPNALVPGSGKANNLLTATLAAFSSCTAAVKGLGKPPSTRLLAFQTTMKGMCVYAVDGAHDVAQAIGVIYKKHDAKLAGSLLVQGMTAFTRATSLLATAQQQLQVVGGKSVFAA